MLQGRLISLFCSILLASIFEIYRQHGKYNKKILPFAIIFQGIIIKKGERHYEHHKTFRHQYVCTMSVTFGDG